MAAAASYPEPDYYAGMSGLSGLGGGGVGLGLSPLLNYDPSLYMNEDLTEQFVFPEEATKKRSLSEKMFSSIGTMYLAGIASGGSYGLYEGMRYGQGETISKLRLNSVLNGVTRRGPFFANSLAVVALMYGCTNFAVEKIRGSEDEINSVIAGTTTGLLFRCTAGPRAIGIAGAVGLLASSGMILLGKFWNNRGQTWQDSSSKWE